MHNITLNILKEVLTLVIQQICTGMALKILNALISRFSLHSRSVSVSRIYYVSDKSISFIIKNKLSLSM